VSLEKRQREQICSLCLGEESSRLLSAPTMQTAFSIERHSLDCLRLATLRKSTGCRSDAEPKVLPADCRLQPPSLEEAQERANKQQCCPNEPMSCSLYLATLFLLCLGPTFLSWLTQASPNQARPSCSQTLAQTLASAPKSRQSCASNTRTHKQTHHTPTCTCTLLAANWMQLT